MSNPRFNHTRWLMVGWLFVAFALRVYQLGSQSLWSDEGLSLYRARLPVGEILTNVIIVPPNVVTIDTHPPLYYLALSATRALLGESEFALRFLSVFASMISVALIFSVGRRLYNPTVGSFAALLKAMSPFMVWYAQEARMYAVLTALSLASIYSLLHAIGWPLKRGSMAPIRLRDWLPWLLLTVAALYTHVTMLFLMPFEALLIGASLLLRRWREALLALLGLTALALPLLAYAWSRSQSSISMLDHLRPLDSIVPEIVGTFLIGRTNEVFQPWWLLMPGLVLLTIGVVAGLKNRAMRFSALATLGWLIVPLLLIYFATMFRPFYAGPRHVMLIVPPWYLLLALGLAWLWARQRTLSVAAAVLVLAPMIVWLNVQYFDAAYRKDDIRSAARAISEQAMTDDVIIVHDAVSSYVFKYYYTGVAPWIIIPEYPSLNVGRALEQFQTQAQAARRVWFLTDPPPLSGFPGRVIDEWARGNLLRLDHQSFPSIWLGAAYQLYTAHFPIFDVLPDDIRPAITTWPSEALRLAGQSDIIDTGGRISGSLYWQLDEPGKRNLATTLTLIDAKEVPVAATGGTIFDNWSVRDWPVGKFIRQDIALDTPVDLPAGEYRLLLTVSVRQSAEPIPISNGALSLQLGAVTIGSK